PRFLLRPQCGQSHAPSRMATALSFRNGSILSRTGILEGMVTETIAAPNATHAVFNQPPPLEDYDVFAADRALTEALRREGAAWAEERARAFGTLAGRRETIAWGFQAND